MLRPPTPFFGLRVQFLKFFPYARSESVPHKIVGVLTNYARSIHLHSLPLPATESKNLHVELIRKPLRPFSVFGKQVLVEDAVKFIPVSNFLITCRLVDQRDAVNVNRFETPSFGI